VHLLVQIIGDGFTRIIDSFIYAAPVIFITLSVGYFKKFDLTTPLFTAIFFTAFVVFMDAFVVAFLI